MTSTDENRALANPPDELYWQYTCAACGKTNDMREVYGRCPHPSREEQHPDLWNDDRIERERQQRVQN